MAFIAKMSVLWYNNKSKRTRGERPLKTTIQGLSVHYEVQGQGPETVLFLHGWGAPITAYRPVLELLAQRFRVVAFDMPGVGETDEPSAPLTLDNYVAFTLDFCREMGIDNAVLVCHSHGGRIAVRMLSDPHCPVRCRRAVLIDAAGVPPRRSAGWKLRQRAYRLLRILGTARLTAPLFAERYEVTRDRRSSADYRAASPVMRSTLSNVVGTDLTPLMPAVQAEVLLVWGDQDTATPLSDGQEMVRLMPNAGLAVVQHAGHFPFVDNWPQFQGILQSYFGL